MTTTARNILPLEMETQTKLASSVRLLSLNQVIMGLLENALDARSRTIRITLNYSWGFCSVQDDGVGIDKQEFEVDRYLATPYCTSKANSDLQPSYGRSGQFLAAVAGLALLSISSKHADEDERILLFNCQGRLGQAGRSSELDMVRTGTKVKVYNLFTNFPVRLKHFRDRFKHDHEIEHEFAQLRRNIVALHLASAAQATIWVEETVRGHKLRVKAQSNGDSESTSNMCDLAQSALAQAGLLRSGTIDSWRAATLTAGDIVIRAAFAANPVPSKQLQFVALGQFPLLQADIPELYALVNSMFETASFVQSTSRSSQHKVTAPEDNCGARQSHVRTSDSESCITRHLDRWPAFFLRILVKQRLSMATTCPQTLVQDRKLIATVCELVKSMIKEFLSSRTDVHRSGASTPAQARVTRGQGAKHGGCGRVPARGSTSMDRMPLNHWSRVRTAHLPVLHDTLAGLPFMSKIAALPTARTETPAESVNLPHDCVITDDSRNTVADTNSICEDRPDVGPTELADPPSCSDKQENVVQWHDPSTGHMLLIDAATGNVVVPRNSAEFFTSGSYGRSSSTQTQLTARKRRRSSSTTTPSDLIAKIGQYVPRLCPSKREARIPSLLTRDHEAMTHGTRTTSSSSEELSPLRSGTGEDISAQGLEPASITASTQICRDDLFDVRVVAQVDRKFLLVSLPSARAEQLTTLGGQAAGHARLALIDQHAASERVGVEALFHSLHHDAPVVLDRPLVLELDNGEVNRLNDLAGWFARWGVHYHAYRRRQSVCGNDATDHSTTKLYVEALPAVIAERCRHQPKLVVDMLRREAWSDDERRRTASGGDRACRHEHHEEKSLSSSLPAADIPARLLEMINSRACRSAIMFNDELSTAQCERLIHNMAACALPFQCAHGRRNTYVLPDLPDLSQLYRSCQATRGLTVEDAQGRTLNTPDDSQSFGRAWRLMR